MRKKKFINNYENITFGIECLYAYIKILNSYTDTKKDENKEINIINTMVDCIAQEAELLKACI